MSEEAKELLLKIFNSYNSGENYNIKTPVSSKIHEFNMTIKEIESYIEFLDRNMMNISITLNDNGLEYCMENFI